MALVTLVGYPCSGKTRRAAELAKYFEARLSDPAHSGPKFSVVVVDDESNHVSRSVYDGKHDEESPRRLRMTDDYDQTVYTRNPAGRISMLL
jgi:protein KTI12